MPQSALPNPSSDPEPAPADAPRAPPPRGWRWVRRRAPRKVRTFQDDFPTPELQARAVVGWFLSFMAFVAIFVLPAVLWFLIQIEWLTWNLDYSTLELLGLGLGILIVLVVNGLDPFGRKGRAKATAAPASAPSPPGGAEAPQ